jgi:hypothetical protein
MWSWNFFVGWDHFATVENSLWSLFFIHWRQFCNQLLQIDKRCSDGGETIYCDDHVWWHESEDFYPAWSSIIHKPVNIWRMSAKESWTRMLHKSEYVCYLYVSLVWMRYCPSMVTNQEITLLYRNINNTRLRHMNVRENTIIMFYERPHIQVVE